MSGGRASDGYPLIDDQFFSIELQDKWAVSIGTRAAEGARWPTHKRGSGDGWSCLEPPLSDSQGRAYTYFISRRCVDGRIGQYASM